MPLAERGGSRLHRFREVYPNLERVGMGSLAIGTSIIYLVLNLDVWVL
ncbi:MAG: hypothetical protein AVDCRST_MAG68-3556 [uncultured Gemmatimonadetes bacterium]|uniref:Uncharacterized protein n=1 Tax=uncultured Gemmatimonadota bacterium TaxID=203437 RepID=A0A6J4M8G4_9BACT|nr:MAG: hypothetical protein AVDCRST_MAG68-3556 [uncultured Gemmatimonadota bacterium]